MSCHACSGSICGVAVATSNNTLALTRSLCPIGGGTFFYDEVKSSQLFYSLYDGWGVSSLFTVLWKSRLLLLHQALEKRTVFTLLNCLMTRSEERQLGAQLERGLSSLRRSRWDVSLGTIRRQPPSGPRKRVFPAEETSRVTTFSGQRFSTRDPRCAGGLYGPGPSQGAKSCPGRGRTPTPMWFQRGAGSVARPCPGSRGWRGSGWEQGVGARPEMRCSFVKPTQGVGKTRGWQVPGPAGEGRLCLKPSPAAAAGRLRHPGVVLPPPSGRAGGRGRNPRGGRSCRPGP